MNERQRQIGWALIGVLVGSIIMVAVGAIATTNNTVNAIREQQKESTKAREANDQVLRAIRSCTDPEGKCFRRGQRRTASAIASINEVTVLAAVCAANADQPTVGEIQKCIGTQLALIRRTPPN